jgi:hypothetical protein
MNRLLARTNVTGTVLGAILLCTSGCIGPNPLFSIGQTALNTTVTTIVSTLWSNFLSGN